jgi:peptidoglycan-associated lipoprotein
MLERPYYRTEGGKTMMKRLLTSVVFLSVVLWLGFTVSCSKKSSGIGPGVNTKSSTNPGSTVTVGSQTVPDSFAHLAVAEPFPTNDIHFKYDSYRLLAKARKNLRAKAKWLLANKDVSVVIEGHCDERGLDGYNLALGDQRAQKVKEYLVDLGVSPDRLTTISYGEERPVDPRHNEEAWAKNRRAHFR